jgi:hypothetical protein
MDCNFENEKRIKNIIMFLKSELENNYITNKSYVVQLQPDVLGKKADRFVFEAATGFEVDIEFWDTGIVQIGAGRMDDDELIISLTYVPDDYNSKKYPKDSEDLLIQKTNELLTFLNKENPKIRPKLPDFITG